MLLDQIAKALATRYLADAGIVRLFGGDLVWLVYVLNPGSAFGMRFLPPLLLMMIAVATAVGLGYFLITRPLQPLFQGLPLALIMGGAAGNMVDRIRLGEVVDFVSVDMPDFLMDRWPVFNVADAAVSVGIVLLMIASFLKPPAEPAAAATRDEPDEPAAD